MDNRHAELIIQSVLPRYGLQVRGLVPLDQHTCLLDSDRGVKRLRIDTDERLLRRRHALFDHLAKNGYRRIPRHIRTLYGEPWVHVDQVFFTLSDDWEGRVPNVMPLDMRIAGRNLARLHEAVRGLQLEPELALTKRHGTWLERFSRAGDELTERLNAWSELSTRNPLQETFLQHAEWLAEQIGRSVEGLSSAKYEEVARKSEQDGEFALGEYRLADLRIDEEGRVATLHIDDAVYDLPLYDVAKFAHSLIERGETDMAQIFVNSYAEAAELNKQDVMILDAYLDFPHAAYRHIVQYVRLKKGADVFAERLEQAVRAGQSRSPILYGADSVRWT